MKQQTLIAMHHSHDARLQLTSRADVARALNFSLSVIEQIVHSPTSYYGEFTIPKSDGTLRTIRPPIPELRCLQRALLPILYKRLRLPPYMHGGLPGRSIFSHASTHLGRAMVATLDVKKFFASTSMPMVEPVLTRMGIIGEAAADILALTMLENSLPEGSPTSSLLANFAFSEIDQRFLRLCRHWSLSYSRYVDDIAVSGDKAFRQLRGAFVGFISAGGYQIAPNKIHFYPASERQVVTGLVVNDRLRPTREFLDHLKHSIHLCMEHGPARLAAAEGISVQALKARLTGQARHVLQCDSKLGHRLQGLLCGIDWVTRRSA